MNTNQTGTPQTQQPNAQLYPEAAVSSPVPSAPANVSTPQPVANPAPLPPNGQPVGVQPIQSPPAQQGHASATPAQPVNTPWHTKTFSGSALMAAAPAKNFAGMPQSPAGAASSAAKSKPLKKKSPNLKVLSVALTALVLAVGGYFAFNTFIANDAPSSGQPVAEVQPPASGGSPTSGEDSESGDEEDSGSQTANDDTDNQSEDDSPTTNEDSDSDSEDDSSVSEDSDSDSENDSSTSGEDTASVALKPMLLKIDECRLTALQNQDQPAFANCLNADNPDLETFAAADSTCLYEAYSAEDFASFKNKLDDCYDIYKQAEPREQYIFSCSYEALKATDFAAAEISFSSCSEKVDFVDYSSN